MYLRSYLQSQMQAFQNDQISEQDLPRVENLAYQPLEPRYKRVLILLRMIGLMVVAILFIVFFFAARSEFESFQDIQTIVIIGLGLLYLLLAGWGLLITIKGFDNKFYALRQKDIVYTTGWLWKSTTTAPFIRVQHVSIDQGPLERQYNLSKLRIFTAGGNASDMTIPGLDPKTADQLKEFIVTKTKSSEKITISDQDEEQ